MICRRCGAIYSGILSHCPCCQEPAGQDAPSDSAAPVPAAENAFAQKEPEPVPEKACAKCGRTYMAEYTECPYCKVAEEEKAVFAGAPEEGRPRNVSCGQKPTADHEKPCPTCGRTYGSFFDACPFCTDPFYPRTATMNKSGKWLLTKRQYGRYAHLGGWLLLVLYRLLLVPVGFYIQPYPQMLYNTILYYSAGGFPARWYIILEYIAALVLTVTVLVLLFKGSKKFRILYAVFAVFNTLDILIWVIAQSIYSIYLLIAAAVILLDILLSVSLYGSKRADVYFSLFKRCETPPTNELRRTRLIKAPGKTRLTVCQYYGFDGIGGWVIGLFGFLYGVFNLAVRVFSRLRPLQIYLSFYGENLEMQTLVNALRGIIILIIAAYVILAICALKGVKATRGIYIVTALIHIGGVAYYAIRTRQDMATFDTLAILAAAHAVSLIYMYCSKRIDVYYRHWKLTRPPESYPETSVRPLP